MIVLILMLLNYVTNSNAYDVKYKFAKCKTNISIYYKLSPQKTIFLVYVNKHEKGTNQLTHNEKFSS